MLEKNSRYWMGKCQSCRHSIQSQSKAAPAALLLICTKDGDREVTRGNWQCGRYEYEPGSIE